MFILMVLLTLVAIYFLAVYAYFKRMTAKYFTTLDRTQHLQDNLQLKSVQQIRERYAEVETINILVLTGGGVRGLIPLQVLAELERLTGKKTGELFDFMAGTSTGAINCAIMALADDAAGRRFSAADIARDYVSNIRQMFSAPWYHKFLTVFGLFGPHYLPEGKLKVLRSYFGEATLADLATNLLVPVYDLVENALRIIRNWEPKGNQHYTNYLLLDLIHGASNPPLLFLPQAFLVGNKKKVFIDPGVVINNPAEVILLNTWLMFPNKKLRIVQIANGGDDGMQYRHAHMAEFGAYGLLQYLLNSPIISSKFSTDLVLEYIKEAGEAYLDVDFVSLDAKCDHKLASGDVSDENMAKVQQFAQQMLDENASRLADLAAALSAK